MDAAADVAADIAGRTELEARVEIRQPKELEAEELEVFNSLSLSVVVAVEILAEIAAEIFSRTEVLVEVFAEVLTEVLEIEASLVVYYLGSSVS